MTISLNHTAQFTITFQDIQDIKRSDRLPLIVKINESVDRSWSVDTKFISKKYLNSPQNYQLFKVAKIADEIIGYAIIRKDYTLPNASYLSFIALHSDYRGKGVGTCFLKEAVDIIKQEGSTSLKLDCKEKNYPFYIKFADKHKLSCVTRTSTYQNGDKKLMLTIDLPNKNREIGLI